MPSSKGAVASLTTWITPTVRPITDTGSASEFATQPRAESWYQDGTAGPSSLVAIGRDTDAEQGQLADFDHGQHSSGSHDGNVVAAGLQAPDDVDVAPSLLGRVLDESGDQVINGVEVKGS